MPHLHVDPIQSQPFLSAVLKFMYRYLVISSSLAEEIEENARNFDEVFTDDFVRNHLQPAVVLAIDTKRSLGQQKSWRLPACISYQTTRLKLICLVDRA